MRVVATADLHYEMPHSVGPTHRLAPEMCAAQGDALMVLGDTYASDPDILRQCLRLFEGFPGPKLLSAGNHDLWTRDPRRDSQYVLDVEIPTVAGELGFHVLDQGPFVHDGVGFVGGCGWYDYSFRDARLGVPIEFYRLKRGPGAIHQLHPKHEADLPWDELDPRHLTITAVWNDGVYVRWDHTDETFTDHVVDRLERDIRAIEGDVRAVVCGTHHIPFGEMVVQKQDANWAFGNAFMGSRRMGEVLLAHDTVRASIFGHSHTPGRRVLAHIDAVNVGSTYRDKRFVTVQV